jgi:hypothetical protein
VRETLRVLFDGPYTIFPFLEWSKPSLDDFSDVYFNSLSITIVFPLKSGNCENDRLFGGYGFFFRFSHFHISKTEASKSCVEGLFSP